MATLVIGQENVLWIYPAKYEVLFLVSSSPAVVDCGAEANNKSDIANFRNFISQSACRAQL